MEDQLRRSAFFFAERSAELGSDQVVRRFKSSLLHVPVDLELETSLDPEIRNWMAFAVQKCGEIACWGKRSTASGLRSASTKTDCPSKADTST